MTNSKLKNRVQISSSVDPELWEGLQRISNETKIPLARLLDMAMELLIKQRRKGVGKK